MFFRLAIPLLYYLAPRFLPKAIRFLRLVWRLTFDKRVSMVLRVLVPLAIVYAVIPYPNFIHDTIHPILGRFDDVIILGLAVLFLTKLAPKHVVNEHLGIPQNLDRPQEKDPSKVVDGSSHVIDDE